MADEATIRKRKEALVLWKSLPAVDERKRLSDRDLDVIAYSMAIDPADIASARGLINPVLIAKLADSISEALQWEPGPDESVAADQGAARRVDARTPASNGPPSQDGPNPDTGVAFARTDLSRTIDSSRVRPMRITATGDELQLSWHPYPASDGATVIYRASSGDDQPPTAPDRAYGKPIGHTGQTTILDRRPFAQAVRYYRVWAYVGASADEAASSQPVLWGEGNTVAPVKDWSVKEREGQVILNWTAAAGTEAVLVYRHDPGTEFFHGTVLSDGSHRPNLHGFVDHTAQAGASYEYTVCATATAGANTVMSPPISGMIEVPVTPDPVVDLEAHYENINDKSELTVTWTKPRHGKVEIYLTQGPPGLGPDQGVLEGSQLSTTQLQPGARVDNPPDEVGEKMIIGRIPWPLAWPRVWVTAVTRSGDRVCVGNSWSTQRLGRIRNPELRERVDTQVLVFRWPEGAASVFAYVTPSGHPFQPSPNAVAKQSLEQYEKFGGMLMRNVLPAAGCDIYLVPIAWKALKADYGEPTKLVYPGLAVVRYRFDQEQIRVRKAFGREEVRLGPARVVVEAAQDLNEPIEFVLVHNPERLPLHARDTGPLGRNQLKTVAQIQRGVPLPILDLPATGHGYLRLFAQLRSRRPLAVLDPDVNLLQR